ncbi:MAG: NUDIX hydrolase, partial [Candidatus Sumerlaeia bacterium]|nr:NUDIX hydrolase [Candidatus Sumerlaeia bacterium]
GRGAPRRGRRAPPLSAPPPWRRLSRRTHLENRWIKVHCDEVAVPSGALLNHWVVDYQRVGVGVVPVLPDGRVLLGLHYRYTVDRWGWEIAAGGADPGEDLEAAALRELAEETRHRAARLERLGEYHPAPGLGNERFVLYRATGIAEDPDAPLDTDEIHGLRAFDRAEVHAAIAEGEVFDGFTITGLLWALR